MAQSVAERRVAVLVNRNARGVTARALDVIGQATPPADLYSTTTLQEAEATAARLVERGYETVLLAGGDGTIARGVEHLVRAARGRKSDPPAIGVLRLGTGNAFADAVGAAPARLEALADAIAAARTALPRRTVPMLESLGRLAPFCGFGVDAQILEDHARLSGWLDGNWLGRVASGGRVRYGLAAALRSVPRFVATRRAQVTVRNLGATAVELGSDGQPTGRQVAAGDAIWSGACTLAACATIPFFGLGLRMFPFAELRGDRFHLRAGEPGLGEILWSTPAAFAGRYFSPRVHDYLADRVALELDREAPFEAGGELCGRHARVEIGLGARIQVI